MFAEVCFIVGLRFVSLLGSVFVELQSSMCWAGRSSCGNAAAENNPGKDEDDTANAEKLVSKKNTFLIDRILSIDTI